MNSLNVPSRLKGIETHYLRLQNPLYKGLNEPSRLKGIETYFRSGDMPVRPV